MKKICKLCYREVDENLMAGAICITCANILGKGPGYSDYISQEQAEKWFEGLEERKKSLRKAGKLKDEEI